MSVPAEKTTTLAALRQDLAPPAIQNLPQVKAGFTDLQSFELAGRAANALAASTLVPKEYQGHKANCLIALEMAQRIGASPLMVMQNLYVVHGRPSWSAQFLIASFNQCGRFSAIRYKWEGEEGKDTWSCQAYAVEKETGEVIKGPVISIGTAKKEGWYQKSGSKWQSIPQLMLMYRAAAWLVRTHAPEISMGLQTQDEVNDVFDAQRGANGQFAVDLDSLRSADPSNGSGQVAYDVAGAKAKIAACESSAQLRQAWDEISEQLEGAGLPMPIEVEAAFKDREAAIEQKERQL